MPSPFRFPTDFATSPTALSGTKTLDGRVYGFRFLPNTRADDGRGGWYVDLFTVLAAPVVLGIKLIQTDDLFAAFRTTDIDVPPGRVVVRRTDGLDQDPSIFDLTVPSSPVRLQSLGSPNVVVEYVSLSEIAALAAAA